MAWMIARDDSENLTHYGVKGMKWKQRKAIVAPTSKAGMVSNYNKVVAGNYGPYGPADKLNRPTHGSLAGVPSNLATMGRISFNRTNGSRYAGKNEDGDTIYRTTGLMVKSRQANPTRKLNTPTKFVTSGVAIKKKLRSNNRYKGSRAGMAAEARRRGF